MRWPAVILAETRKASVRGRRAVLITSIRAMKKESHRGVAVGRKEAKKLVSLE